MEKSKMKNVVVLRNLSSNLIEEAFIIVKSKKTAKKLEFIDRKNGQSDNTEKEDEYIVREAESVICNYVNLIENKNNKKDVMSLRKKCKILVILNAIISACFLVSVFVH